MATVVLLLGIDCILYATHRESNRWTLHGCIIGVMFYNSVYFEVTEEQ